MPAHLYRLTINTVLDGQTVSAGTEMYVTMTDDGTVAYADHLDLIEGGFLVLVDDSPHPLEVPVGPPSSTELPIEVTEVRE